MNNKEKAMRTYEIIQGRRIKKEKQKIREMDSFTFESMTRHKYNPSRRNIKGNWVSL